MIICILRDLFIHFFIGSVCVCFSALLVISMFPKDEGEFEILRVNKAKFVLPSLVIV